MPELIGADHEDRVVEALGPEQIDGTRVAVEADVVGREGGSRQCEPILSGRVNLAVCGTLADEDDEPLHAELLSRRLGDGDMAEVRRVEGAAVEDGHSHSSSSSPSSTSSPIRRTGPTG